MSPGIPLDRRVFGLCADCLHVRRVESGRGSVFALCEVGLRDPRYRRYPFLPVRQCDAYQRAPRPDERDA